MNKVAANFQEFIKTVQTQILQDWENLPGEQRQELEGVLRRLPGDYKGWRILLEETVDQFRIATGKKTRVTIIGPVNSGKSTLYNQLLSKKEDRSEVSPVPGTTRRVIRSDAGLFQILDTPGADAAGPVGELEKERALMAAREADFIILLFDASHGVRAAQRELYEEVSALNIPLVIGLNKIDMVPKAKEKLRRQAAEALGLDIRQILPLSAKKRSGMEALLFAVAKSEPALVAALGAALPEYRRRLSEGVLRKAMSTAGAVGATPLPFLDFIPLIAIQSAMVISIARIYDEEMSLKRARELIATFGLGMLGRMLFYEASKFAGPPGWLVAAAIAAATTATVGYAAISWFDKGERLSSEAFASISKRISDDLIGRIKRTRRKPQKEKLQNEIELAMQSIDQTTESTKNQKDE